MFKKSLIAAGALFGLVGSASAQWTVIDPTNLVENTVTALHTIQSVEQAIKQTEQQIAMVEKMENDIKGLDVAGLVSLNSSERTRALAKLEAATSDFNTLQSSLGTLSSRMTAKIAAAGAVGMTPSAFYQKQISDAKLGNTNADSVIQRDAAAVSGAQNVIKQAQQWQTQISGLNSNLGGAMQLMNTQLNQLAVTNSEMLTYLAQASTDRKTESALKQAQQATAAQNQLNKMSASDSAKSSATATFTANISSLTTMFNKN
jgi:conjugal transfer/entry exclusion protein